MPAKIFVYRDRRAPGRASAVPAGWRSPTSWSPRRRTGWPATATGSHARRPRVDASLLAQIRGAVAVEDPRSRATLDAVLRELVDDDYCFRFRSEDLPLGEAEGAFLVCGFWLAMALAQQRKRERAVAIFQRGRTACGTPGLFSEEFDVTQRQLRGYLPQAFVHALLLESAVRLDAD
ncbi:MAG TPA: glycoside hydrolase family 15 protein [Solirubrobacterales bacterium]